MEAHLIAIACGDPPEGFARWSLRLLADKLVELRITERMRFYRIHFDQDRSNISG